MSQVPSSVFRWFSSVSRSDLLKADDSSRKHMCTVTFFLWVSIFHLPLPPKKGDG